MCQNNKIKNSADVSELRGIKKLGNLFRNYNWHLFVCINGHPFLKTFVAQLIEIKIFHSDTLKKVFK